MSEKDNSVSGAESRETYYAAAQSWAEERDAARRKSARVAWIVAGVATGIAALEALALIALTPLKTVVPYTLLVDRNTGFVQALDGTHPQVIKADSALTQSLLAQYVIAREGYDVATVADQYRRVSLWSADAARRDYLALMPASNPQSPVALYGRSGQVSVRVASVSALNPSEALVRFVATRRDAAGGGEGTPAYWVAVVKYRFVGDPQKIEDRLVNPLGFQVVSYRRDQEAPPASAPNGPATIATSNGASQSVTAGLTSPEAAMARDAEPTRRPIVAPAQTRSQIQPQMQAPPIINNPAPRPPVVTRYAPWHIPQPARPQVVQPGGGEP